MDFVNKISKDVQQIKKSFFTSNKRNLNSGLEEVTSDMETRLRVAEENIQGEM